MDIEVEDKVAQYAERHPMLLRILKGLFAFEIDFVEKLTVKIDPLNERSDVVFAVRIRGTPAPDGSRKYFQRAFTDVDIARLEGRYEMADKFAMYMIEALAMDLAKSMIYLRNPPEESDAT